MDKFFGVLLCGLSALPLILTAVSGTAHCDNMPVLSEPSQKLSPPSIADSRSVSPAPAAANADSPFYVDGKIEMERRHVQEIPLEGIQNVLVVDPSVVSAVIPADRTRLEVQALSLGVTYVIVWTRHGRKSFQIHVVPSLIKTEPQSKRKDFEIVHGLSTFVTASRDDLDGSRTKSQTLAYSFHSQGETRMGASQSELRVERKEDNNQISFLRSHLRNRLGDFHAGDVRRELSYLTFPLTSFQGAEWQSPSEKLVSIDILGGYLNKQLWNYAPQSVEEPDPFAGIKTSFSPNSQLEFFLAGSKRLNPDKQEGQVNQGGGANYRGGLLSFRAEASESGNGKGWFSEAEIHSARSHLIFTHRKIDTDYVLVSGSLGDRGRTGQTVQAGLKKFRALESADIRYDQFRADYLPSRTNPFSLNREWQGRIKAVWKNLDFYQDVLFKDYPGMMSPVYSQIFKTRMIYDAALFLPQLTFRSETGLFPESEMQNFSETALGAGVRIVPSRCLSFAFSAEKVFAQRLTTGEQSDFGNFSAGMRLTGSLWIPALKHTLDLDFQDLSRNFSNRSRNITADFRTEYEAGKNLRYYISGQFEKRMAQQEAGHTINMSIGVDWRTASLFALEPSRAIAGQVFRDLNNDGQRQAEEPGLEGIAISLNGSRVQKTDASGNFRFGRVRGEAAVRLDTSGLPAHSRVSSSNPQIFSADFAQGKSGQALFAVAHQGEISGGVYIDMNSNGTFDKEDKPVRRVAITLNGKQIEVTGDSGQYHFMGAAPGPQQLSVNILTLPPDMRFLGRSSLKFDLAEGESKECVFLIYAIHSMRGQVCWDKNKNRRCDADEPGIPGITLPFGSEQVQTNEKGQYHWEPQTRGNFALQLPPKIGQWSTRHLRPMKFSIQPDQPFIEKQDLPLE